MVTVNFRSPDGSIASADGAVGESVMQLAVQNGVTGIVGECGGSLMCATCHVYVDEGSDLVGVTSEDEDEMLEAAASPRTECSRLSCQIVLRDEDEGIVVDLPPAQR